MTPNTETELRRLMTDVADRHQQAMQGMSGREAGEYVKRTIGAATIVFGVYPDAGSPNGVDMHIIKGSRELQIVIASNQSDQFSTDDIPSIEHAPGSSSHKSMGDGKIKSDS